MQNATIYDFTWPCREDVDCKCLPKDAGENVRKEKAKFYDFMHFKTKTILQYLNLAAERG